MVYGRHWTLTNHIYTSELKNWYLG